MSPDGTCIFTSDLNHSFSVYPIDSNIQASDNPHPLKEYAQFTSADPIWAFASNPRFNLNDSNTTHVLISRRDRYITLHNALWDISNDSSITSRPSSPINIAQPLTSYKLINALTEAVTAPLSLTYSAFGTHFFAGHRNCIATFDLSHPDKPILNIPTIPSARSKLKGGGRGFKGWISALSLSPPSGRASDGLLAAGARTRNIGIYDAASGQEVTTFSLPGTIDGKKVASAALQHIVGDGVSQLKYSPCGTYLYVAERSSDALLIYDVRNFALALGYCVGRNAGTKQKLGFDVWSAGASPYDIEAIAHEVWAGGTDGRVRVWRDPYRREGAVQPDEEVVVGKGDAPVVGTMVHESGSLAVAACGRVDIDDGSPEVSRTGNGRGGSTRPRIIEYGNLEILGLS
ncbi:WD40-repeat-containing domain protein [Phaeosphaeria sp. MPI-PUGE-AT-0046c]|nr:WD40-repeat-containing domain protein [Phaeosphaeria sp. MPI-PUGE-AT-0046c]